MSARLMKKPWRRRADGVDRVSVVITLELSLDDVAMVLARAEEAGEPFDGLQGDELRRLVRQALLDEGEAARYRDDDLLADRHYVLAARAYGEPS